MANSKRTRKSRRSIVLQKADELQGSESSGDGNHTIDLSTDTEAQLRPLLDALQAFKKGDFSARLPKATNGVMGQITEAFNDVIGLNESLANETVRISQVVGEEGKVTERASVGALTGGWETYIGSLNRLINNLARSAAEVTRVITAVAGGDLSKRMTLEIDGRPIQGEFLRIGTKTNSFVDQLNAFAGEVTRVAREVGTEGILGGQAEIPGVSGTWKDLTDNVNTMASKVTDQVRNIAEVSTAIADGDLSQKGVYRSFCNLGKVS